MCDRFNTSGTFIETIITELDEADPQDELEIYYLKFADAEQLAEDLADLFEGGNAGSDDDWRPWWDRGRGRDRGGEEGKTEAEGREEVGSRGRS